MIQALRIANVPREEFERLVEGPNPPTPAQLAKIGTRKALPRKERAMVPCPRCGGTGKVRGKRSV